MKERLYVCSCGRTFDGMVDLGAHVQRESSYGHGPGDLTDYLSAIKWQLARFGHTPAVDLLLETAKESARSDRQEMKSLRKKAERVDGHRRKAKLEADKRAAMEEDYVKLKARLFDLTEEVKRLEKLSADVQVRRLDLS